MKFLKISMHFIVPAIASGLLFAAAIHIGQVNHLFLSCYQFRVYIPILLAISFFVGFLPVLCAVSYVLTPSMQATKPLIPVLEPQIFTAADIYKIGQTFITPESNCIIRIKSLKIAC
jgi:hypothetical protein